MEELENRRRPAPRRRGDPKLFAAGGLDGELHRVIETAHQQAMVAAFGDWLGAEEAAQLLITDLPTVEKMMERWPSDNLMVFLMSVANDCQDMPDFWVEQPLPEADVIYEQSKWIHSMMGWRSFCSSRRKKRHRSGC